MTGDRHHTECSYGITVTHDSHVFCAATANVGDGVLVFAVSISGDDVVCVQIESVGNADSILDIGGHSGDYLRYVPYAVRLVFPSAGQRSHPCRTANIDHVLGR